MCIVLNEMVRQDKIAYLTTFFQGEGWSLHIQYVDPIESIVKSILSKDSNSDTINILYSELRSKYPTWDLLSKSNINDIALIIDSCGKAEIRANSIIALLEYINTKFENNSINSIESWSDELIIEEFTSINGIEIDMVVRMLNNSLNRSVFPIDSNSHYIIERIGIISRGLTLEQAFYKINPYIPFNRDQYLYFNIVKYGKLICTKNNPKCEHCKLSEHCDYFQNKNEWLSVLDGLTI
jgi:endonuclease III